MFPLSFVRKLYLNFGYIYIYIGAEREHFGGWGASIEMKLCFLGFGNMRFENLYEK